jgi:hypothetical protein
MRAGFSRGPRISAELFPKEWGTPLEQERRRRIQVAIWAWAYEVHDVSLVSDHVFDMTCRLIDPTISTKNRKLDNFFKKHFGPDTGQWVHKHPERQKLDARVRSLIASIQSEKDTPKP